MVLKILNKIILGYGHNKFLNGVSQYVSSEWIEYKFKSDKIVDAPWPQMVKKVLNLYLERSIFILN